VPADVQGDLKVVGLLEGWPYPVKEDPTVVKPQRKSVSSLLQDLFR
jgi:hypothetical protein